MVANSGEEERSRTIILRVDAEITSHFRISSSGHPPIGVEGKLWPIFTHKILKRAVLFLRFCSLRSTQIRPKSERQNANLFLRQPLGYGNLLTEIDILNCIE